MSGGVDALSGRSGGLPLPGGRKGRYTGIISHERPAGCSGSPAVLGKTLRPVTLRPPSFAGGCPCQNILLTGFVAGGAAEIRHREGVDRITNILSLSDNESCGSRSICPVVFFFHRDADSITGSGGANCNVFPIYACEAGIAGGVSSRCCAYRWRWR